MTRRCALLRVERSHREASVVRGIAAGVLIRKSKAQILVICDVDGHFESFLCWNLEGGQLSTVSAVDGNGGTGNVRICAVIAKSKDSDKLAVSFAQLHVSDVGATGLRDIGIREERAGNDYAACFQVGIDTPGRGDWSSRERCGRRRLRGATGLRSVGGLAAPDKPRAHPEDHGQHDE